MTGSRTWVRAERALPAGAHVVGLELTYDGGGVGKGADIVLTIDGADCGSGRLRAPSAFSLHGRDDGRRP